MVAGSLSSVVTDGVAQKPRAVDCDRALHQNTKVMPPHQGVRPVDKADPAGTPTAGKHGPQRYAPHLEKFEAAIAVWALRAKPQLGPQAALRRAPDTLGQLLPDS